jgi:hypothetical protein
MTNTDSTEIDSLEEQLRSLYEDRELLENELGVSDSAEIVAMVRSLESQLNDVYQDREEK